MKNTLNNPFDSAYNATETTDIMETVIFAEIGKIKPKFGLYYELQLLAKSQIKDLAFGHGRIEGNVSDVNSLFKLFKKSVIEN